ncbi:YqzG/YhdC family protein [Lentibacillus sediminis]|uniref:YqzG/YhdC family protein n=1 Tax=Lentibacillus sediminis TaxID=1940529 RepID=UPI001EFDDC10|nr:YqzG/YhdC family protein [Lentibacillus sediminis]
MKKLMLIFLMPLLLAGNLAVVEATPAGPATDKEIPPYAKWGRMAVKETMKEYPEAKIVDYMYQGSHTSDDITVQTFKLWLNENDKEFGVYVKIEHDRETEKVEKITFEETDR